MSDSELEQQAQLQGARDQVSAGGDFAYPEVMVEVERLQTQQSSRKSAFAMLIITIVLFFLASKAQDRNPVHFTMLLIPILLFHELGHFLAMRLFGYRNVKMFFIPFLGAAVKGQHYNVPGWKKVIVALMGPVPGVLLGAALGVAGIVAQRPILVEAALLTLILNGFNLLPFLPLDGGRVVHALLFVRHPLLDAGFRIVAAAGLIGIGAVLKDRILPAFGVIMLISLPIAYRMARIAAELRRSGVPTASPDSQNIPPEIAKAIITKVKSTFSGRAGNKALAQRTLEIYETINARPPGWLASLGLGAVHISTLIVAMLFGALFIVGRSGTDFTQLFRSAIAAPTQMVSDDEILIVHGSGSNPATTMPSTNPSSRPQHVLILANFPGSSDARSAFDRLSGSVTAGESIQWFGQTLLVACPNGDDESRGRWLTALEGETNDVFVRDGQWQIHWSFQCVAPNETTAKAIVEEAEAYLSLSPTLNLIPPWSDEDTRTPEVRARHLRARQTLVRLMNAGYETGQAADAEFEAISKQITRATNRRDNKETQRLFRLQQELLRKRREKARLEIAQEPGIDREVADLYLARFAVSPIEEPDDFSLFDESGVELATPSQEQIEAATKAAREQQVRQRKHIEDMARELGPKLGQISLPEFSDDSQNLWWVASGYVNRTGLIIDFSISPAGQPLDEAKDFAHWLFSKRCQNVRYNFGSGIGAEMLYED